MQLSGVIGMNILMNGVGKWIAHRWGLPTWMRGILGAAAQNAKVGSRFGAGSVALMGIYVYSLVLCGVLLSMEYD